MISTNKKLIIALILVFVLLSTIAYAQPITDSFKGGLIAINDFFENEGYAPYATAIDFFFFSLLFIAIYMMGARYAFKEIKRPEQVIVILLGLMTAFMLVIGGFSAVILLPYIHWLLYLLLFLLIWWLLKFIKNPFWRFILALLLTILIIALAQWLFGYLKTPEIPSVRGPDVSGISGIWAGISRFFSSLADSFRSIDLGVTRPGVPDYLQDLFKAPTLPVTEPTGPETLPSKPVEGVAAEGGGRLWLWVFLAVLIGIAVWKRNWIWERLKRLRQPTPQPTEELTIQRIIQLIDEAIQNKESKKREIEEKYEVKLTTLKAADRRQVVLNNLAQDIPNLYTEEGRRQLGEEHQIIKQLYENELALVRTLKELKDAEKALPEQLDRWVNVARAQNQPDISQQVNQLKTLIRETGNANALANVDYHMVLNELPNLGIILLINLIYDFERYFWLL